jgi:Flp pilus assembly protein TadD
MMKLYKLLIEPSNWIQNRHRSGATKAWILGNLKSYDEALQAADRAIELDSEQASFWNNKGIALENLGKITEANAAFAKAKRLAINGQ